MYALRMTDGMAEWCKTPTFESHGVKFRAEADQASLSPETRWRKEKEEEEKKKKKKEEEEEETGLEEAH
uniref:Uncharacterized protein n=1 Tax=Pristionchus pacificus TaxID=54126 RepID=A0A2A6D2Z8_PRIPA|eukprot:PDM84716.1 hypothetical protein PRIPAC_33739 [Pristionchus pacificus]